MGKTKPTPSTLHNFIPLIEEMIRPKAEDVFLSADATKALQNKEGRTETTDKVADGMIAYLHMWTYTDIFKTDHLTRAKYCNNLRDTQGEIHYFFHKNRLRYGNMTGAIQIASMYTKTNLLEKIGSKDSYEAKSFEEKIALSEEVVTLVRAVCNKLLNGELVATSTVAA
jgi:hypothetical protein